MVLSPLSSWRISPSPSKEDIENQGRRTIDQLPLKKRGKERRDQENSKKERKVSFRHPKITTVVQGEHYEMVFFVRIYFQSKSSFLNYFSSSFALLLSHFIPPLLLVPFFMLPLCSALPFLLPPPAILPLMPLLLPFEASFVSPLLFSSSLFVEFRYSLHFWLSRLWGRKATPFFRQVERPSDRGLRGQRCTGEGKESILLLCDRPAHGSPRLVWDSPPPGASLSCRHAGHRPPLCPPRPVSPSLRVSSPGSPARTHADVSAASPTALPRVLPSWPQGGGSLLPRLLPPFILSSLAGTKKAAAAAGGDWRLGPSCLCA